MEVDSEPASDGSSMTLPDLSDLNALRGLLQSIGNSGFSATHDGSCDELFCGEPEKKLLSAAFSELGAVFPKRGDQIEFSQLFSGFAGFFDTLSSYISRRKLKFDIHVSSIFDAMIYRMTLFVQATNSIFVLSPSNVSALTNLFISMSEVLKSLSVYKDSSVPLPVAARWCTLSRSCCLLAKFMKAMSIPQPSSRSNLQFFVKSLLAPNPFVPPISPANTSPPVLISEDKDKTQFESFSRVQRHIQHCRAHLPDEVAFHGAMFQFDNEGTVLLKSGEGSRQGGGGWEWNRFGACSLTESVRSIPLHALLLLDDDILADSLQSSLHLIEPSLATTTVSDPSSFLYNHWLSWYLLTKASLVNELPHSYLDSLISAHQGDLNSFEMSKRDVFASALTLLDSPKMGWDITRFPRTRNVALLYFLSLFAVRNAPVGHTSGFPEKPDFLPTSILLPPNWNLFCKWSCEELFTTSDMTEEKISCQYIDNALVHILPSQVELWSLISPHILPKPDALSLHLIRKLWSMQSTREFPFVSLLSLSLPVICGPLHEMLPWLAFPLCSSCLVAPPTVSKESIMKWEEILSIFRSITSVVKSTPEVAPDLIKICTSFIETSSGSSLFLLPVLFMILPEVPSFVKSVAPKICSFVRAEELDSLSGGSEGDDDPVQDISNLFDDPSEEGDEDAMMDEDGDEDGDEDEKMDEENENDVCCLYTWLFRVFQGISVSYAEKKKKKKKKGKKTKKTRMCQLPPLPSHLDRNLLLMIEPLFFSIGNEKSDEDESLVVSSSFGYSMLKKMHRLKNDPCAIFKTLNEIESSQRDQISDDELTQFALLVCSAPSEAFGMSNDQQSGVLENILLWDIVRKRKIMDDDRNADHDIYQSIIRVLNILEKLVEWVQRLEELASQFDLCGESDSKISAAVFPLPIQMAVIRNGSIWSMLHNGDMMRILNGSSSENDENYGFQRRLLFDALPAVMHDLQSNRWSSDIYERSDFVQNMLRCFHVLWQDERISPALRGNDSSIKIKASSSSSSSSDTISAQTGEEKEQKQIASVKQHLSPEILDSLLNMGFDPVRIARVVQRRGVETGFDELVNDLLSGGGDDDGEVDMSLLFGEELVEKKEVEPDEATRGREGGEEEEANRIREEELKRKEEEEEEAKAKEAVISLLQNLFGYLIRNSTSTSKPKLASTIRFSWFHLQDDASSSSSSSGWKDRLISLISEVLIPLNSQGVEFLLWFCESATPQSSKLISSILNMNVGDTECPPPPPKLLFPPFAPQGMDISRVGSWWGHLGLGTGMASSSSSSSKTNGEKDSLWKVLVNGGARWLRYAISNPSSISIEGLGFVLLLSPLAIRFPLSTFVMMDQSDASFESDLLVALRDVFLPRIGDIVQMKLKMLRILVMCILILTCCCSIEADPFVAMGMPFSDCIDDLDCSYPNGHCVNSTDMSNSNSSSSCVCDPSFATISDSDKPCDYKRKSQLTAFLLNMFLFNVGASWFYISLPGVGVTIFLIFACHLCLFCCFLHYAPFPLVSSLISIQFNPEDSSILPLLETNGEGPSVRTRSMLDQVRRYCIGSSLFLHFIAVCFRMVCWVFNSIFLLEFIIGFILFLVPIKDGHGCELRKW